MLEQRLAQRLIRANNTYSPIRPTVSARSVSIGKVNRALNVASSLPANANIGTYSGYGFTTTAPVAFSLPGSASVVDG